MDDLIAFLRIPSISTLPQHQPDMKRAQQFLVDFLTRLGFATQIIPGTHHDLVFGQLITNPSYPTVLIYGHYDVQPPDPLDQWLYPPFEPTVKDNQIYARGAVDDKGQLMVHLQAVKQLLNSPPPAAVNFKFLIEGEEEIGSPSLPSVVSRYSDLLQADYIVVSDTEMPSPHQPAIHVSLRGLLYTEIQITTADHDLHSGQFGGVAPNPAIWLSWLICQLKNQDNQILIPGFYDDVILPSPEELADFKLLEPAEQTLMSEGSQYWIGGGESQYSLNERRWSRPTLDVNGMCSGFTGEGSKTIIPSRAMAKISMRLVPNQNPQTIFDQFQKYVQSLCPPNAKLEIIHHADCLPYKAPVNHPIFSLAKDCLSAAFNAPTVFYATGGSIGAIPVLTQALGHIPCLMIAMGNADNNLHAPNEFIRLANLTAGVKAMTDFYSRLKTLKS